MIYDTVRFNVPLDTTYRKVILETIFSANHLTSPRTTGHLPSTSKTNITATKRQHKKPKKKQLMQTTTINKTKPDETKA